MPNGQSLPVSRIWGHPEAIDAANDSKRGEINIGGLATFHICALMLDSEAVSMAITNPANLVQSGSIAKIEFISHEFFAHLHNFFGDFIVSHT